jgi:hypothetical protein
MHILIASTDPGFTGHELPLLLLQSAAYIAAVAIILRMAVQNDDRATSLPGRSCCSSSRSWGCRSTCSSRAQGAPAGEEEDRDPAPGRARVSRDIGLPRQDLREGAGVFEGNLVSLLPDGVEAFNFLCDEIEHARETIHITTYILGRDGIARDIGPAWPQPHDGASRCACSSTASAPWARAEASQIPCAGRGARWRASSPCCH